MYLHSLSSAAGELAAGFFDLAAAHQEYALVGVCVLLITIGRADWQTRTPVKPELVYSEIGHLLLFVSVKASVEMAGARDAHIWSSPIKYDNYLNAFLL